MKAIGFKKHLKIDDPESLIDFDMEKFEHQLQELYEIANRDSERIKDAVKIIVPTYVKPETVNEQVEKK